jgi:hypothetical protein
MARKPKVERIPQWHDDFMPSQENCWAVPAKWLLDQVCQCLLADEENLVFACKDGKLYIQGYRPAQEEVKRMGTARRKLAIAQSRQTSWAEEFPPPPRP